MNKRQLSILIASLFVAAPALAQSDPFVSTGSVTAGGIYTKSSDTKDPSKFQEYQDLDSGMLSNFGFTGRNSTSWIDAYGENIGRDDTYFSVRGGMYDVFKARAYTNWIPHNFLFNGITPFAGSGTSNQTATFQKPNLGTWTNVDIGYQRKDTGGYFEWQQTSPFYFRVDGNQVKFDGSKVGGSSNTTSPGGGYVDLSLPVEYTTNNVSFEAGYTTRTMTFTASFLNSNFSNDNAFVNWNNPSFGSNVDRTYLPPDNQYQRLALNGVVRALPWNSTLAARYTWDKTTSDFAIGTTVLNAAGSAGYINVQPDHTTYDGDETRQTFTLGWSATPLAGLDTKFYFNWQKLDNDSTDVTFCPSGATSGAGNCGGTFENDLWDYKKQNAGLDLWYRIDRNHRIGGGYDYYHITQNRFDFDESTSNLFWVEYKYSGMDGLGARLKYSYLDRNSDFLLSDAGANANDPSYLLRYVQAFDLADLKQNRIKLTIDWAPADNMGVAFEGIWKDNDYDDTTLGRTGDRRWEIVANLTYGTPSTWRLNLFGDYENVKYDEYHRYINNPSCTAGNPPAGPNCHDPNTLPPTAGAYNWSSTVKNTNWLIGLGVDFPVNDAFTVIGSVLYEKTDGSADFESQNNYGNPLPLTQYPDVKMTSLNLKGVYKVNRNWSITGGYAYQKYDYSDDQFNGYKNTIPFPGLTTGSSQSYLSGWNAFQSYNANIFYLLGTFKY